MSLLQDPVAHTTPFRCFTFDTALPERWCAALEAQFAAEPDWQHHVLPFYEALVADVTAELPADWWPLLRERVSALVGFRLGEQVRVTIQRMEPGHRADPHTDRPLVGYEVARLVVQLTPSWQPGDGGLFRGHPDEAGEVIALEREPLRNRGFVFEMTPETHHSVTHVVRRRHAVVFNFWHAGNPEPLADQVEALFADFRVDGLPRALDALAAEVEATEPEEVSERASSVAWALQAWGYPPEVVVAGYTQSVALGEALPSEAPQHEAGVAIELARWVASLHLDPFRASRWEQARALLAPVQPEQWPALADWWGRTLGA